MGTEAHTAFTPEDLRKQFERLQSDLNVIQNELDQALGVWRTILTAEKQEFKKALQEREKAWERDEALWQKDREAFEQKIQELDAFFAKQLATTESNAVRALNELDGAWQAERLRWQQTVTQDSRESRQREELLSASQKQLEQHVAQLEEENARLQSSQGETHQVYSAQEQQMQEKLSAMEALVAEWQAEKEAWQQSLSERMNVLRQNEESWASERQQKDILIQSLQQELVQAERRLRDLDGGRRAQSQHLETYVSSLETQIAALQEFLQQFLVPSNPRRRVADRVWSGGDPVNTLSRGPR